MCWPFVARTDLRGSSGRRYVSSLVSQKQVRPTIRLCGAVAYRGMYSMLTSHDGCGLKGDSQIVVWSFTRVYDFVEVISNRIRVILRAHWALQGSYDVMSRAMIEENVKLSRAHENLCDLPRPCCCRDSSAPALDRVLDRTAGQ